MSATITAHPTWEELAALEPRLADLLAEIRRERPGPRSCANARWLGYGRWRGMGYKPRMARLVGWYAAGADPRLRTPDADEAAYAARYDALPDCDGCACPAWPSRSEPAPRP